ncbi:hypothetical protein [Salinicoccus roseus]
MGRLVEKGMLCTEKKKRKVYLFL